MSLFKQIQLLITLLLLATLTIVMKINFDNAREFTANQLFNNGKNIANVLSLSLGSRPGDKAFMDTSINAMYDGGYFETIKLIDQKGEILYDRHEKIIVDGVPGQFIKFVDLKVPVAVSQVSSGWNIIGTLHVKAHAGSSYVKLWETFKNLCILFIILGSVALILSYLILRYLLQSLVKIQYQAEAISNNDFILNDVIPNTPELKKLVFAMNTMVEKVQGIYNRQLAYLKDYNNLIFKDVNTGLHNRKFLVKQIESYLDSDNEKAQGQVVLLSLVGMELVNISVCHPVLDVFFKDMAAMLKNETKDIKDAVTAQLPRHEYGVILPNCSRDESLEIANALMQGVIALLARTPRLRGVITTYGGIAAYGQADNFKMILSKTDYALSVAKSGPSGTIEGFHEKSNQAILGKFEWKTMIEGALRQNRFLLTAQPVISNDGEFHREVYVNMIDSGGVQQNAGYFMPMVTTLGLANQVDRYVLENAVKYLENNPQKRLAVNITTELCTDRLSLIWLRQFLTTSKHVKDNIVLEIHEGSLIQHPDIYLDIVGLLKGMGYSFGIDQFTLNDTTLNLLKDLNPDYIKVEQGYLFDTDNQINTEMALNALITITDSLDIKLIAVKIEDDHQRQILTEKNINYFQGRGVSDIAPLTDSNEL